MWSRVQSQLSGAVDSLTTLGIALVEATIVFLLARWAYRFVHERLLHRLDSPDVTESRRTAIGILTTVSVSLVAMTLLLALWGVTWSGIVTAISLGTLGLLLGVQDVLKSLIGGIFLILEQPYSVGHRISVRDVTGRVISIELRTTVLRSDDGHRIVLPNSIVFTDSVTNYSLERQIQTEIVVSGIVSLDDEQRTSIEEAVAEVEGVAGAVEVRVRRRTSRIPKRFREGGGSTSSTGRTASRSPEVLVSWLGGGEPAVQRAVITRLRESYPSATVRRRKVRGTVVPQRINPTHRPARALGNAEGPD